MSDYNELRARIADEINRRPSDLIGSPSLSVGYVINREINSAIRHYESTRFRWNEVRESEFATATSGTRNYSLPADFVQMDSLKLVYSGSYIILHKRTWHYLENQDRNVSQAEGLPTEYATYGNVLRVYPTPNQTVTLVASYIKRFRPSSLTGSYCEVVTMGGGSLTATSTESHNNPMNGWTTDGEELIRERAKAGVKINYLHDDQARLERVGPFLSVGERVAFDRLADETSDALSTGKIEPYCV